MSAVLAFASRVADRINPVAVKEFRQAVRSQWVVGVLLLFLLVNLGILGSYLGLFEDTAANVNAGRDVFGVLLTILILTCVGAVPLYAGLRLSSERNDTNLDLFFVTTVTPGAIVRGKYLAALGLTLLVFSVCMPFMAVTYLLRGIDIPTIGALLAVALMASMAANALAIFAGCVSGSILLRGLAIGGVVVFLFYLGIGIGSVCQGALMVGVRMFGHDIAQYAAVVGCGSLGIGAVYVLSAALLSPKSSNRMLVPRLYLSTVWALSGVAAILWSFFEKVEYPVIGWLYISGASVVALLAVSLGERDHWSARVRQTIPRNPLLRAAAFLFYSGSGGGVLLCVMVGSATLLVSHAWLHPEMPARAISLENTIFNMAIILGYALAYCLTIAALQPLWPAKMSTTSRPVLAIFLAAAAWLLPLFGSFLLDGSPRHEFSGDLLGSPMILTTGDKTALAKAVPVVVVWLMLASAGALPWWLAQWRRFKPYQAEALAQATDLPHGPPTLPADVNHV